MIEMLTLIALWCGQPVNATKGAMGIKTGSEITDLEVKTCRAKLIACVDKPGERIDVLARRCFIGETK